jgi:hypothetical protein
VGPTPALVSPLLALDAALLLNGRWRVGLTTTFSFGGEVPLLDENARRRGTLRSRDVTALASAMACTDGRLTLCGGARAGLRFAIGDAFGPFVFQTRTAVAVTPTLGPAARLGVTFGVFLLALDATLLVNLPTPPLAVDGLPTTLAAPRVEGLGFVAAGVLLP